jgi:prolyl oligopeptidase
LVALGSLVDPAAERLVVDPNAMDAKGAIAIDFYVPSLDGKLVAVSLSRGGSESGDLHLYEVATGSETGEVIPHANNGTAGGSVAWGPDGRGFWYTRYPRGEERPAEDADFYQQVYYHRIGTPTEQDTYELGKEFPRIAEIALVTRPDGRWLLTEVKNGDGGEVAYYLRPAGKGGWTRISDFKDQVVQAEFGLDDALYLLSRSGAPRGKLLRLPLATPSLVKARVVVPESARAIQDFTPTRSRLYVVELDGGPTSLRVYGLAGKAREEVPILPVSSVGKVVGLDGDDVLFENESFLLPGAWYRYRAASGVVQKTRLAQTSPADFSDAEVVREFALSRDGTRVPMNIIRLKGARLDGNAPALLYAYGGYGISQVPRFSGPRRLWLDEGGVSVIANVRGGGEYGDGWHLQGNLTRKQNVFDDFFAAARLLVTHEYTSPAKLAIYGGSNGGLLMGAALTQHPEEYRAVVSFVGIYDAVRSETTANGAFNVTEFGTVKDPEQFKALYAYSPYHRVVDGVAYPAILLIAGENDKRVDPWHSRKFAARLQAAGAPGSTVLLRTNASSGHGIGTALDELIGEYVDMYAFLLHELGVTYHPPAR